MISEDYYFRKLLHAVTYYLSYQERIGRNFMVNESSLKYPVADYLTGFEMPLAHIQLEYPHPKLKGRRIDLVIRPTEDKIEKAFEFKIAKYETQNLTEQKRIFNDLMRLHLIASQCNSYCYFMIVGKQEEFISYFRSTPQNKNNPTLEDKEKAIPGSKGFYTEWFGFKEDEQKTFNVKNSLNDVYKNIYQAFPDDYNSKDNEMVELPDNLTTTCQAISILSRDFEMPYVGGIWKIGK